MSLRTRLSLRLCFSLMQSSLSPMLVDDHGHSTDGSARLDDDTLPEQSQTLISSGFFQIEARRREFLHSERCEESVHEPD